MRYLIGTGLAFTLCLPVAARDFLKGMEAYGRVDYVTTLRELRPLAEQVRTVRCDDPRLDQAGRP